MFVYQTFDASSELYQNYDYSQYDQSYFVDGQHYDYSTYYSADKTSPTSTTPGQSLKYSH